MRGAAGRLFAAIGFAVLFAGSAAADEPKPVDLSDLRDAVKSASKRGANLLDVEKALEAAEKVLAKPAAARTEGEPPAELVALREAVEAAARKGEAVDAIRTELDAVEKAAVGKVLTAPKAELPPLREARPSPETNRFGRRGFGFRGNGGIVIGGRGGAFRSVTIANGKFTLQANVGDVVYELSGELVADDPDAVKVVITDGDKKVEAESLKKVPEKYQADVEKLLKSIRR